MKLTTFLLNVLLVCVVQFKSTETTSNPATVSGIELSLVGPFTDDHGYLAATQTGSSDQEPVCEINRFAANLLCPQLYPNENRTLTWFGYAQNTSYFELETANCYVINCGQDATDLSSCTATAIAFRRQKAYIKCMTAYQNSYCQLDDVLVVDPCDFLEVDVINYWNGSRILLYLLATIFVVGLLVGFILFSPYQNPTFQTEDE